jgi:hypothetical protein
MLPPALSIVNIILLFFDNLLSFFDLFVLKAAKQAVRRASPPHGLSLILNAIEMILLRLFLQLKALRNLVRVKMAVSKALTAVLPAGANARLPVLYGLAQCKEHRHSKEQNDENVRNHNLPP